MATFTSESLGVGPQPTPAGGATIERVLNVQDCISFKRAAQHRSHCGTGIGTETGAKGLPLRAAIANLPGNRHFAEYSRRQASSTFVPLRVGTARARAGCWWKGDVTSASVSPLMAGAGAAHQGGHPLHVPRAHASFPTWLLDGAGGPSQTGRRFSTDVPRCLCPCQDLQVYSSGACRKEREWGKPLRY